MYAREEWDWGVEFRYFFLILNFAVYFLAFPRQPMYPC